ncbi:SEC-C domain-containing protein [Mycolicibacterium lacusdiani]|uniref:SEC-C domain-containing protein n=1 Tax=Mycolicibacterium lacusdiani TaxID=2895283 RepID=UPI001F206B2A|nr:SEC-C domain-containing protein [Mycolicibacterium lacusdiani]
MFSNRDDEQLVAALERMALAELVALQRVLHDELRTGRPTTAILAKAAGAHSIEVAVWLRFHANHTESAKLAMLLGTLAVSIAWRTYRGTPAPDTTLRQAMTIIEEGRVYMLPVPRTDPCFCGSRATFKSCHGMPPVAAPAM